jgi:hypothetical protein
MKFNVKDGYFLLSQKGQKFFFHDFIKFCHNLPNLLEIGCSYESRISFLKKVEEFLSDEIKISFIEDTKGFVFDNSEIEGVGVFLIDINFYGLLDKIYI